MMFVNDLTLHELSSICVIHPIPNLLQSLLQTWLCYHFSSRLFCHFFAYLLLTQLTDIVLRITFFFCFLFVSG